MADEVLSYDVEDWDVRHKQPVAKVRNTRVGLLRTDDRGVLVKVERHVKFVTVAGKEHRILSEEPTREALLTLPGFVDRRVDPLPTDDPDRYQALTRHEGSGAWIANTTPDPTPDPEPEHKVAPTTKVEPQDRAVQVEESSEEDDAIGGPGI